MHVLTLRPKLIEFLKQIVCAISHHVLRSARYCDLVVAVLQRAPLMTSSVVTLRKRRWSRSNVMMSQCDGGKFLGFATLSIAPLLSSSQYKCAPHSAGEPFTLLSTVCSIISFLPKVSFLTAWVDSFPNLVQRFTLPLVSCRGPAPVCMESESVRVLSISIRSHAPSLVR